LPNRKRNATQLVGKGIQKKDTMFGTMLTQPFAEHKEKGKATEIAAKNQTFYQFP